MVQPCTVTFRCQTFLSIKVLLASNSNEMLALISCAGLAMARAAISYMLDIVYLTPPLISLHRYTHVLQFEMRSFA